MQLKTFNPVVIHEQQKKNGILPSLRGTREREHPPFLIQQSTQGRRLCSLPSHTLAVTYLHTAIPKPHQQESKERGQTKYHRKILVFHPKINAPCHFGKVLLDFVGFWVFFLSQWFEPTSVEKMGAVPPASMRAGLGPSWEEFTLQRYFLQSVSQLKQCWCGPLNRDLLTALTPEDSGLDDLLQTSCGTEHSTKSSGALCSIAAVNTCKSTSIRSEKVGLKWENKASLRLTRLVGPLAF